MQPLTNTAITAARRAGDVILAYYRRGETGDISRKSENDFVTEADQNAESRIIDTIRSTYPDHALLAEESGSTGESDTVWIIDPIDGTMNFMRGIPHFCVSIACQINGRVRHAVIYDPVNNELFVAEQGGSATLDGRRIRVSNTHRLRHAILATGFAYQRDMDIATHLPLYNRMLSASAHMRSAGSAALDMAYVAAGRLDGFWEFGLSAWDLAAGSLLVRAAGGIVSDAERNEASPLETGNVLAANAKLYPQMLDKTNQTPSGH